MLNLGCTHWVAACVLPRTSYSSYLIIQLKNQHMRSICSGQESYTPPLTEDMSTAALGGSAHVQYMFNRRNTYWHYVDGELVEWLVMLSICWTLAGLDWRRTPFPAAILASDAAMAACLDYVYGQRMLSTSVVQLTRWHPANFVIGDWAWSSYSAYARCILSITNHGGNQTRMDLQRLLLRGTVEGSKCLVCYIFGIYRDVGSI